MSFRSIAALLRRHLLAVLVVLVLAAGAGYGIRSSAPTYTESATVVFTLKKPLLSTSYLYEKFRDPLITTEVMMAQDLGNPAAQNQIRATGGTAQFQMVPLNVYDMQYPNYSEPLGTVTVSSPSPAQARRTLTVVIKYLSARLGMLQAQVGVHSRDRIQTYLVGEVPPVKQPGSRTRVFAGLALLTVVAVFMVSNFLDRRQHRRRIR